MPAHLLELVVNQVVVRHFRVPAPTAARFFPAVAFAASARPVAGYLVGVREGDHWGWWGPIDAAAARGVVELIGNARERLRGTPAECARRLRRSTRHAHTGAHAVSIGAFELACWDLLGQRHGVPVWKLLRPDARRSRTGTYATCFGIRLDSIASIGVVSEVGAVWPVQKWRPVGDLDRGRGLALRTARAAGRGGIALDFCGRWPTAAAMRYARRIDVDLAFIEEPAAPGAFAELDGQVRPAPVAAGEHCYNADETAVLVAADIDVWQPDAVFCGGFDALMAITARAAAARRKVYPHGGGLLPALHAAIAGAQIDLLEFHLLLEPRRQIHLGRPLMPEPDGTFGSPTVPGWAGPLRPETLVGASEGRCW